MNNLSSVFTKKNIEILSLLSKESLSLRDIAEKIKCSPGKVHQAIEIFKRFRIVKTIKHKNRLIIHPNRESVLYQKIKVLMNMDEMMTSKTYSVLTKIAKVGIYGSYAQGTDDQQSDIDLLLLTEKKELELREKIRALEQELGRQINPFIVSKQKLNRLANEDKEFYLRLKLTTLSLHGEIFE